MVPAKFYDELLLNQYNPLNLFSSDVRKYKCFPRGITGRTNKNLIDVPISLFM